MANTVSKHGRSQVNLSGAWDVSVICSVHRLLYHMMFVKGSVLLVNVARTAQVRATAQMDGAETEVVKQPAQVNSSNDFYRRGTALEMPPSSMSIRKRTHEDNELPTGMYPMPKWPAGHTSEAFESVAVKKASILSAPEIYAEIVHHGKPAGELAGRCQASCTGVGHACLTAAAADEASQRSKEISLRNSSAVTVNQCQLNSADWYGASACCCSSRKGQVSLAEVFSAGNHSRQLLRVWLQLVLLGESARACSRLSCSL